MAYSFTGPVLIAWGSLLGLFCGSFANVLIHRLPRAGFFSMGGRSCCPFCGGSIPWWANIPVISFLCLRGRCRSCRGTISFRYPLVEVICAILFFACAWVAWGDGGMGTLFACLGFFLSLWLVAASFIDLEHRIIPDSLTLSGLVLAPLLSLLVPVHLYWHPVWQEASILKTLVLSFMGMMTGAGVLWGVGLMGRVLFQKEAMGLGDVKLMAFLGGILGPTGILLVFFLATLSGALFGALLFWLRRDHYMPFGPYLSGWALGVYLYRGTIEKGMERAVVFLGTDPVGPLILLGLALVGVLFLFLLRRKRVLSIERE